ncbi:MAG: hypothetical protein RLP09_28425, partial [Sandaracinaceae bacterium]
MRALILVTLLWPAAASAQESAVVVVDDGAPELTWRRWQRRVEGGLERATTLEQWARAREPV